MEQNREPRNRLLYNQLIFEKGAKAVQWGTIIFSTIGAGTTRHPHTKKKVSRYRPCTLQKINSECIIDLKVKHKAINI